MTQVRQRILKHDVETTTGEIEKNWCFIRIISFCPVKVVIKGGGQCDLFASLHGQTPAQASGITQIWPVQHAFLDHPWEAVQQVQCRNTQPLGTHAWVEWTCWTDT